MLKESKSLYKEIVFPLEYLMYFPRNNYLAKRKDLLYKRFSEMKLLEKTIKDVVYKK